jgi:asparagine N-glycosylation enzyme membrane subunit Stt3
VSTAHQKLAVVIVLVALGGTMWAAYCAYHSRWSGRLTLFGGVAVAAIAAQALLGTILGVSGSRPVDPLHFVFGPATLLALPIAARVARGREPRPAALILGAGWFITLVLSLRAAGTGGVLT